MLGILVTHGSVGSCCSLLLSLSICLQLAQPTLAIIPALHGAIQSTLRKAQVNWLYMAFSAAALLKARQLRRIHDVRSMDVMAGPASCSLLIVGQKRAEASDHQLKDFVKPRARRHSAENRFFLTACAQFKDEDGILVEWVRPA